MRFTALSILGVAALLAAPVSAHAGRGPCVTAAKGIYVETLHSCKDTLQATKDGCLNRDPACMDVCRDDREQCVIGSGLPADIDACNATKTAAIENCIALFPAGSDDRDGCIDNAQVEAFICRDNAREANRDEIKACRVAFRGCVQLCSPASPPVDALTCKVEAKAAFKACKATAREDYQIEKDVCRGLGHTCVEACRAERATCVDGVGLEAALDACNAARAAGITACNGDDLCIDQVQVIAFQCRDQAREDALPGLTACREAFRACVHPACEGASPSGAFLE